MDHTIVARRLSNGITVVLVPLSNTAAVTTMVFMGVGSRYESDTQRGLAHFVEHMVFKGGKKYKNAQQVAQAMDAVGGEFNAYTNYEVTDFYTKVSSEHLELGLDVLSDMVLHAQFPSDELEKEKGVIVEEINMYEDMPMRKAYQVLSKLVFGDSGLGLPIIGSKESVTAFTQEDFVHYREQFYKGEKCTVVIVGAVNPDTTFDLVERYFSIMPQGDAYVPPPAHYLQTDQRVLIENKPSEQTHIRMALQTYPLGDPRRYVLNVLSVILGGNMSSRLFSSIREQQGLCYYINSFNDSYTDNGALVISAGVDNTRLDQAVKAIVDELRKLKEDGVEDDEVNRAKQFLLGKIVLNVEDSEHVAELYGLQWVLEGKIEPIQDIREGIEEVSKEMVMEVAQDIIQDQYIRLALIGPHDHAETLNNYLHI